MPSPPRYGRSPREGQPKPAVRILHLTGAA